MKVQQNKDAKCMEDLGPVVIALVNRIMWVKKRAMKAPAHETIPSTGKANKRP